MAKIQPQSPSADLGEKQKVIVKQSPAGKTQVVPEKGFSQTPTYKTWSGMRQRCYHPKTNGYHNYGGRGITVCDQWRNSFEQFVKDMGIRPHGMVIDRIDVNGNYEPGNCRWIKASISSRNRRDVVVPYLDGEPKKVRANKVHRRWVEKNREHRHEYASNYWKQNKSSRSAYFRKWQEKNREARNKYSSDRYRLKPEVRQKASNYNRLYRENNRSKVEAKALAYRQAHRVEIKSKNRAYYLAHREKIIAHEKQKYWARKEMRKEISA